MRPVLIIPGIGNSGSIHWQSIWQARHKGMTRVMQRDWANPNCGDWIKNLDLAVARCAAAPILVAHSLGCLLVAKWASRGEARCYAALLVAPPDPSRENFPKQAQGFDALPDQVQLPRLTLISSDDDPYAAPEYSRNLAANWKAQHIQLKQCGHINAASGLGEWPEAWSIVNQWRQEPAAASPTSNALPTELQAATAARDGKRA